MFFVSKGNPFWLLVIAALFLSLWHQSAVRKTWTGIFGTLANSANPDQTPRSRRRTRRLIRVCTFCLKLNGLNETVLSPFRTIFPACTQRQSTHQCCQCFDCWPFQGGCFVAILFCLYVSYCNYTIVSCKCLFLISSSGTSGKTVLRDCDLFRVTLIIFEPAHYKTYDKTCVTSKDSDQTIHPSRTARAFVYPCFDSLGAIEGTRDQRRLWSDCAKAQSDLSLRWSHKSCC